MMLRSAYPDEHSRIKSIMQGAHTPPHARFLVQIKELDEERLIAVFPWWVTSQEAPQEPSFAEFSIHLAGASQLSEEQFENAIQMIEKEASQHVKELRYQSSMLEESSSFQMLTAHGFTIRKTERHCLTPGGTFKQHSIDSYQASKHLIPQHWKIESIRGHKPEDLWSVIAEHKLMTLHSFQNYWDVANREHFEEAYSSVILEEDQIIAVLLVSQRSTTDLHIHIEAVSESRSQQNHIATMMMRNFITEHCSQGFPEHFFSQFNHRQAPELASPYGGKALPIHYLVSKII